MKEYLTFISTFILSGLYLSLVYVGFAVVWMSWIRRKEKSEFDNLSFIDAVVLFLIACVTGSLVMYMYYILLVLIWGAQ